MKDHGGRFNQIGILCLELVFVHAGGVTVPPSAQIYQKKAPTRREDYSVIFPTGTSKKRRPCKTVQNQALFFPPALSPFHHRDHHRNHRHRRQHRLLNTCLLTRDRHSPLRSPKNPNKKTRHQLSQSRRMKKKTKRHVSAKLFDKVPNVLIYTFRLIWRLQSIQQPGSFSSSL